MCLAKTERDKVLQTNSKRDKNGDLFFEKVASTFPSKSARPNLTKPARRDEML